MTILNLTKYGRKLSKRVENTVGKGEIARYEQFLLFPHCFQKACFTWASKGVIVWEWRNKFFVGPVFSFSDSFQKKSQSQLALYHTIPTFSDPETEGF